MFFVAARKNIRAVMSELRKLDKNVKRIMLAGGGNIGTRLAQALEGRVQVKIIERDPRVARHISEQLTRTIVLNGDAADETLLEEENIEHTDVFCAITNDDEVNILSAMLAKRLGASKVMSLINRMSYVDLVESSGAIDVAISSASHHRRAIDQGAARRCGQSPFPATGAAEAIEAVAHGDRATSKVVGRRIDEINLPPGTTIGAIARGDEVIICHHDTVIEADDHVILFLVDKRRINEVERLFQVSFNYL
ncbi:MAG: Trk system potassium transporter TrkA [Candidatus Competibacteraceae bacterium]